MSIYILLKESTNKAIALIYIYIYIYMNNYFFHSRKNEYSVKKRL